MDAETNIYRDSFFAALQRLNAGEIGDTPLTEEDGERIILEGAANILDQKVEKGSLQKKDVTSQPEYVQPLVDYVEEDFTAFRLMTQDTLEKQHAAPVGGMIVCDSSEQAQAVQKELARRGHFHKDSEGELALADGYYEKRNRTLGEFARNHFIFLVSYILLRQ